MTDQEIDIYYKTVLDLVSLAGKVSIPIYFDMLVEITCFFPFLSCVITIQCEYYLLKLCSTAFCHTRREKRDEIMYFIGCK
jgi:hypothetical protein